MELKHIVIPVGNLIGTAIGVGEAIVGVRKSPLSARSEADRKVMVTHALDGAPS